MSSTQSAQDREYELKCYELYLSERRNLNDFQFQQSLSYDRTAITISSGALGLSLTFIKDIVGEHFREPPFLLWAGWGILVVAILMTLVSFQLSVSAYQRQREILDLEYADPTQRGNHTNQITKKVELANWGSLTAIITGLILLTIFVASNTWSSNMTTPIKRGAPPPTSPAAPRTTPGAGSPPATNPAPPPKKG